jgi:NAD-dependent DNA ligase
MNIKDLVLAYRYLYYVEAYSAISDYEYDILEKQVKHLPEINKPGSSLVKDYSPETIELANKIKDGNS